MKIQFLLQTNKNRYKQKNQSETVKKFALTFQIIYKPISKIEMKFFKILIQFLDIKRVEKQLLTY